MTDARLNTVSLRLRVTAAVIVVLTAVLILLGVAVNATFVAQSNRNLDALLSGRVSVARQLAGNGLGPQQIVNRLQVDTVRAHLVLATGQEFGLPPESGPQIRATAVTLDAPSRVAGAVLTLTIDTSLVSSAQVTLRRVLIIASLTALILSALLITIAVRLSLRPLEAMADLAKSIAAGRRGSRLSPTRTDTELGQTAEAFDEMLDELEGAELRARQAEERTRAFLADAAHELRTPIAGVQAAAETLLHHDDQLDLDQRQHLQALLIRESQRAGTLISDLLAAARLDAGVDLLMQPVSVAALASAEATRVRVLHPTSSVTVSGPDLTVRGDPDKINGILRNVIDNAVRASGEHGQVHVALQQQTSWAIVDIFDSGPGVAPADRERIFERLVRLDHGRAADRGGSGLGLAIARGYARAHGGDLTCEDPRGSGALFRLRLPLP